MQEAERLPEAFSAPTVTLTNDSELSVTFTSVKKQAAEVNEVSQLSRSF